jgi:hypothetical protein
MKAARQRECMGWKRETTTAWSQVQKKRDDGFGERQTDRRKLKLKKLNESGGDGPQSGLEQKVGGEKGRASSSDFERRQS